MTSERISRRFTSTLGVTFLDYVHPLPSSSMPSSCSLSRKAQISISCKIGINSKAEFLSATASKSPGWGYNSHRKDLTSLVFRARQLYLSRIRSKLLQGALLALSYIMEERGSIQLPLPEVCLLII